MRVAIVGEAPSRELVVLAGRRVQAALGLGGPGRPFLEWEPLRAVVAGGLQPRGAAAVCGVGWTESRLGEDVNKQHEKKFEQIADECVSRAGSVKCSGEDYVQGLLVIVTRINEELIAAQEYVNQNDEMDV